MNVDVLLCCCGCVVLRRVMARSSLILILHLHLHLHHPPPLILTHPTQPPSLLSSRCRARTRSRVNVMHELHMSKHVMLAVERCVADSAVPFRLSEMDGAFVREEVGAQPKGESALVASIGAFALMHGANVCLEMCLCLELKATPVARELPHFFVHDLQVGLG